MGSRLQLQALLKTITANVYFQPPKNLQMKYPCIRYNIEDMDTKFAGNRPYALKTRYSLTVLDEDPDSVIPKQIAMLPECIFDRFYTADGLNHNVFKIFF